MSISLIILLVSILISSITFLFVFFRNPRSIANIIYGLTSVNLILFSIFNYLSLGNYHKLTYIRLVILTTSLLMLGAYFLVYDINYSNVWLKRVNKFWFIFSILIAILDLTPIVFKNLSNRTHAVPVPSFGVVLFLIQFGTLLILTIRMLIIGTKSDHGWRSQQNRSILIGFIPTLFFAPVTGFALPLLMHNPNFIKFSSLYSTFAVCTIGYAMIKHHLFDVRLIVARSIVYSLALVSMVVLFIVGTFLLIDPFLSHYSIGNLAVKMTYAAIAVIVAFLFQPLKKFFDRITNKLFFRDNYDVQLFLDQFNKILISTFDLEPLLKKISELIEDNIKPTYCLFGLKENNNQPRRLIGSKVHPDFKEEDIDYLRNLTPKMHRKLIVADELEQKYLTLQTLMQQNNVSVIARLSYNINEEGIGYLVLGPKKTGNMYNSKDLNVIEIAVNELVVAIQNSLHMEEIENFNLTLQEKIKAATYKLSKSNEKLRALDEAKDDFVSMASHQLRTPLTSVKGNISLVLDGDAGKITRLQRQLLDQAFASSQRMVFLISDLLNVSRLKTGKFVIERARVNLADVVEDEVNQLLDTARSRHLTLSYDKPEKITELMIDDTKTRQVIMNFIDNAIYYTPANGHINVVLTETPFTIECRVIDNGIGIPKAEQHHLFTKFYRAKNARKARPDGTGLGLFMAKKVIVAEGGGIIFDSVEGKGSTFGFSFPKAKLAVGSTLNQPQPEELVAVG